MLTIRDQQMAILAESVDARFIDRLVDGSDCGAIGAVDVRQQVLDARTRGAAYGIGSNDDVAWFVSLDLKLGRAWELRPEMRWARDILANVGSDLLGRRFRLDKALSRWSARHDAR